MWQDTLLWIAQARLFHPRIQAYVWLVASLFWIIPSKTFSSIIVSWSVLQIGIAFVSVVLLALIPSVLPNIRINLRAVLRNDAFAIVKTLCSVIFFNVFFLSSGSNRGVTDGLLFAVYGQLLGSMELPTWALVMVQIYGDGVAEDNQGAEPGTERNESKWCYILTLFMVGCIIVMKK
ncbi:hypothetical protein F2Q69_00042698 [Brassica cretica]|uniref:Uncharacterized protein n=1 Tax=Brassica cretica TaxID=69181 RepID=A0A8S9NB49_BRACR|nr:hypothetical protein F2Q69_00042698 [Brassica cretica]